MPVQPVAVDIAGNAAVVGHAPQPEPTASAIVPPQQRRQFVRVPDFRGTAADRARRRGECQQVNVVIVQPG